MSTIFPLLNLPSTSLLNVIQLMEFSDFVTLSFLSKRAKQSVELMSLKCNYISFNLTDSVEIRMAINKQPIVWIFKDRKQNERSKNPVPLPDNVTLEIKKEGEWEERWSMKKLSVRQWITHFKTLFQLTHFNICLCSNFHVFDMEDVRDTFPEVNILLIWRDSVPDIDSLVRTFPARNLELTNGCFEVLRHPRQVLIQNFDELVLYSDDETSTSIELDDLLLMNSKRIGVLDAKLTEKDLNRFIKHWIKGSNPRMEMLFLHIPPREEELDEENALKGIRCQRMNLKEPITSKGYGRPVSFSGVTDYVVRFDGTKASIHFSYNENLDSEIFEMYVWHSYCIEDGQ